MTKRILCTIVLALTVAGPASARPAGTPLSGVVVGSGNGAVLVATSGGKLTAVAGHATLGARVVLSHGKLVVVGHTRRGHGKAQHVALTNGTIVPAQDAAKIEIEGVVAAVGTGTVTLNVGGQMLTLPLPAGVSVPASFVGRTVEFELKFPAVGSVVRDDDDDDAGEHAVVTTPAPVTTPPSVTTPASATAPAYYGGGQSGHGGNDHGGNDHGGRGGGDH